MDLKTFLSVLWRRKLIITITATVALIVTGVGLFFVTPVYVASTTLRIGTASSGSTDWVSYDIQYTDRLMNTYKSMVTSRQMAEQVKDRLNLSTLPVIKVVIPANTELMQISVQDTNPIEAQQAANAVADVLIGQIEAQYANSGKSAEDILNGQLTQVQNELAQARADYDRLAQESPDDAKALQAARESITLKQDTYTSLLQQYERARNANVQGATRMSVVQPAGLPEAPAKPHKPLFLMLGIMIGLIGGVGLSFLFESLDTTLYTAEQIEKLAELPVIGAVPHARGERRSILFSKRSAQEESFRRLRTNLFSADAERPLRSLLVTSSSPGEGKSTTVANLALAVAQAGRRVIAVDADLRKPTLHEVYDVPNGIGLVDVLSGELALDEAIQYSMIPGVQVLTSGPASSNPAELLGLPEMTTLLRELEAQFDLVIIDAPSLQTVTDASVLSLIVGGVVVVVARGLARRERVAAALQQLATVRIKPLGLVINRASIAGSFHYGLRAEHPAPTQDEAPSTRQLGWTGPRRTTAPVLGGAEPISPAHLREIPVQVQRKEEVGSPGDENASARSGQQGRGVLRRLRDDTRSEQRERGEQECYSKNTRRAGGQ